VGSVIGGAGILRLPACDVAELRAACGRTPPALIVSGDLGEDARSAVAAAGFTLLSKPLVAASLQSAAALVLEGSRSA